jgi:hypothetical protein
MSDEIGKNILNLPMRDNDAGAETIRDYLRALLLENWDVQKRPFGNSDWVWDLVRALHDAGAIDDEDDIVGMAYLIRRAIRSL